MDRIAVPFDFPSAERYLLGTINETVSRRLPYRLERMRDFLRALGDPQQRYPVVHVGGTSGKGSTCTMIAAVLQTAGKRVGLHTKPHLRSMTERARVNGAAVSEDRFAELLTEMMPAIEQIASDNGRPTYYETLLALAFLHFARENVDVAVVEVGLGGRLDGTNVVHPLVAAITSVGYDHMEVLGTTLEAIAAEKAGIAKPGVPLVVAVDDPGPFDVIAAAAHERGAPLVRVCAAARVQNAVVGSSGQSFTVVTSDARYRLQTPLLGEFQRRNAATALAVLERLPPPLRPTFAEIERAFATLTVPGRMEVRAGEPAVIFDIAHNAEKAEHLVVSLRESFPQRDVIFVVAIGESKDASEILRQLSSLSKRFVFTTFATAGRHALAPERLAALGASYGISSDAIHDPHDALAAASREARRGDLVVVTGSTFVVAVLRECRPIAV
jgi:dihydrofolate synthase / folylpolyglutamate synthase